MSKGLYGLLEKFARERPDTPVLLACSSDGTVTEEITYETLLRRVELAAAYLRSRKLSAGDRVTLDFGNSPNLLIVSWAAWASGITTVPLDIKRDTKELRQYKTSITGAVELITEQEFGAAKDIVMAPLWKQGSDYEALILFTSGTTGHPKGAILTLQNLLINAEGIRSWLRITEKDRFLVELPLHHINSTTFCLSALLAGASIALPPGYSNSHFWGHVTKSGATITSIVQSILFDQLHRTKEYARAKSRLKISRIQIGSAPVVPAMILECMEKFGIPLYQGYGQTETALRVTGVPVDLSREVYTKLVQENSIGEAMAWADVQIRSEQGTSCGEGEVGELVVKGPAVMKGYVAGETAFTKDGYFLTGDIGYYKMLEGHRYFYLKGRKKEIIIKGGINLSPTAIENSLRDISPDVAQAYVVGVPDERYGEEVAAVVVLKSGCDVHSSMRRLKLRLLLGSPYLSAYEMPLYFRHILAEELPLTSTGKVQRVLLKERLLSSYESLYELFVTHAYRFTMLTPHSPHLAASHVLHNHCWKPLLLDAKAYAALLEKQFTLLAVAQDGSLSGQISFTYDGETLLCTSICSAAYTQKPIPKIMSTPTLKEVEEYIHGGHDGIYNFHVKMGASLVKLIPGGRPKDESSCGYTMLLLYPSGIYSCIHERDPVSNQLIEAANILAHDLGARMEALSRPGGLARYLTK